MSAKFLLSRKHRVSLNIYGHQHSHKLTMSDEVNPSSLSFYTGMTSSRSHLYLVETTPASLELSQFVWENRDGGISPQQYLEIEHSFVETPAFLSASAMGMDTKKCIFPIDIDSGITRRRLASSLLPHPWESLILISRYYGRSHPSSPDPESISHWRREFEASCPTAFKILFSDREDHMTNEIFRHMCASPPGTRIAALVGISHMDAIYEKLVLLCQ
jgi:hypothetical protein